MPSDIGQVWCKWIKEFDEKPGRIHKASQTHSILSPHLKWLTFSRLWPHYHTFPPFPLSFFSLISCFLLSAFLLALSPSFSLHIWHFDHDGVTMKTKREKRPGICYTGLFNYLMILLFSKVILSLSRPCSLSRPSPWSPDHSWLGFFPPFPLLLGKERRKHFRHCFLSLSLQSFLIHPAAKNSSQSAIVADPSRLIFPVNIPVLLIKIFFLAKHDWY